MGSPTLQCCPAAARMEEEDFEAAVNFVKQMGPELELSQTDMLRFYALFKQVTEGPCVRKAPSRLNMAEHEKWKAHNALGDMSSQDARQAYLQAVAQIAPDWRERAAAIPQESEEQMQQEGPSSGWDEMEKPVMRVNSPEAEDSLDYILLPVAGVAAMVAVYYWCKARSIRNAYNKLKKFRVLSKL